MQTLIIIHNTDGILIPTDISLQHAHNNPSDVIV